MNPPGSRTTIATARTAHYCREIIQLLRTRPQTRLDLCDAMGINHNSINRHMSRIAAAGLMTGAKTPRSLEQSVYSLTGTPAAVDAFLESLALLVPAALVGMPLVPAAAPRRPASHLAPNTNIHQSQDDENWRRVLKNTPVRVHRCEFETYFFGPAKVVA